MIKFGTNTWTVASVNQKCNSKKDYSKSVKLKNATSNWPPLTESSAASVSSLCVCLTDTPKITNVLASFLEKLCFSTVSSSVKNSKQLILHNYLRSNNQILTDQFLQIRICTSLVAVYQKLCRAVQRLAQYALNSSPISCPWLPILKTVTKVLKTFHNLI